MNEFIATLPKSALTGKPVLHFAHANGIPMPSYQTLLDILAVDFTVVGVDKLGTHPLYPVDNHWQNLTRQVGDSIDDACHQHGVPSVVALGHSLGAMTTLQALLQNPKPISQAVLLDPALLTGRQALGFHLAKLLDKPLDCTNFRHFWVDKNSPAGKSKHRKDSFDNHAQAHQALQNKSLFKNFDERCFDDYIHAAFVPSDDGRVVLAIPKSVEVAIFRTMPSLYWLKTPKPKRAVNFIVGDDSYFTQIGSYRDAKEKFDLAVKYMQGSHMFVLEYPEAVAQAVLDTISDIIKQQIK